MTEAWMALCWRSALPEAERRAIALGPGPDPEAFPPSVLEAEARALAELEELGVRMLTIRDAEYPTRLREAEGPLLLQVAGRPELLEEEGVDCVGGVRALREGFDRTVVVLSKGLLKARTELRGLHDALQDGQVALVSQEPPRASWGPTRDRRRDALLRALNR